MEADLMDIISYSEAKKAKRQAANVQTQLNQAIADGDQLAETQQARVDEDGVAHPTLKDRIDSDVITLRQINNLLSTELTETRRQNYMITETPVFLDRFK